MRFCILLLCLVTGFRAGAQEPQKQVIENSGKPVKVAFECSDEDIRLSGLTCPAGQPCPVYLELSGFEVVGGKLFVAGNLHAENATLWSILLASQDSGKTWTEPAERIRGAGLDHIQFIDFETGWVSGETLGAVPRDPFLLLTRDGGTIWRARPLFSESRAGAIDSFHFDSRTHGTLALDRSQSGEAGRRFESYETMTGGESWDLRQVSDMGPKRAPASQPSDWRMRADHASQSYRLDRRAGSGWETLASFLIRVGECRETEVSVHEPQPGEVEAAPAPEPPANPTEKPAPQRKPRP